MLGHGRRPWHSPRRPRLRRLRYAGHLPRPLDGLGPRGVRPDRLRAQQRGRRDQPGRTGDRRDAGPAPGHQRQRAGAEQLPGRHHRPASHGRGSPARLLCPARPRHRHRGGGPRGLPFPRGPGGGPRPADSSGDRGRPLPGHVPLRPGRLPHLGPRLRRGRVSARRHRRQGPACPGQRGAAAGLPGGARRLRRGSRRQARAQAQGAQAEHRRDGRRMGPRGAGERRHPPRHPGAAGRGARAGVGDRLVGRGAADRSRRRRPGSGPSLPMAPTACWSRTTRGSPCSTRS